jgi:hypothetical protein
MRPPSKKECFEGRSFTPSRLTPTPEIASSPKKPLAAGGKPCLREGEGGKKNSEAAASSPSQGERVAETQHRQRRFAALHKFQLRPDAAALYFVLREAMPCAFLDVSSLNLAAFSAANFFAHSPTPCKPKSIRQQPS